MHWKASRRQGGVIEARVLVSPCSIGWASCEVNELQKESTNANHAQSLQYIYHAIASDFKIHNIKLSRLGI